jgi:hypothetical protein
MGMHAYRQGRHDPQGCPGSARYPYCCGFAPLPAVDDDGGAALVAVGAGAVAGAGGGDGAGACAVAALLGAPEEGVISPLLPHADNANVAAANSPAVTKPFI